MAAAVIDNFNQNVKHIQLLSKAPLIADSISHDNVSVDAKQLIGDALHKRVVDIDHEVCEPGDEDTFYVADLGDVYRQHLRWKKNLPRVKPFYGELRRHGSCTHVSRLHWGSEF